MKKKIAIAVSGGIDSLTAAYILKEQGHDLFGIHFITGFETSGQINTSLIKTQIGIPVETIDCSAEFKTEVVDYFTRTYMTGRTPNPCMVCNPLIKFGKILETTRKMGASYLATGHYARISRETATNMVTLKKGTDLAKDQSYFLSFLSQAQLSKAIFPLGEMTKQETRELAKIAGLQPPAKKESQDICFIKGKHYGEFISAATGFSPRAGDIQDKSGSIIGKHQGLHKFTIGQRRGINCPADRPYYVLRIDMDNNRLVVGFEEDLLASECTITNINWIIKQPTGPLSAFTRLRYRHTEAPSTIIPSENNTAVIRFKDPQPSVTPGQAAVFYKGNEVLGGGWIN